MERETLKLVVQHPLAVGRAAVEVDAGDFLHPTYRGLWEVVASLRRSGRGHRRRVLGGALREQTSRTRRSRPR